MCRLLGFMDLVVAFFAVTLGNTYRTICMLELTKGLLIRLVQVGGAWFHCLSCCITKPSDYLTLKETFSNLDNPACGV